MSECMLSFAKCIGDLQKFETKGLKEACIDVQWVGFGYRNACRRLYKFRESVMTTAKHVECLQKFGEGVFASAKHQEACRGELSSAKRVGGL